MCCLFQYRRCNYCHEKLTRMRITNTDDRICLQSVHVFVIHYATERFTLCQFSESKINLLCFHLQNAFSLVCYIAANQKAQMHKTIHFHLLYVTSLPIRRFKCKRQNIFPFVICCTAADEKAQMHKIKLCSYSTQKNQCTL